MPSSMSFPFSQHATSLDSIGMKSRNQLIQKSTSFSPIISVREYKQTLGDTPSCLEGAPITLGWSFQEKNGISFEEYERSRQSRICNDLILNTKQRRIILIRSGVPLSDILRAERFTSLKMKCTTRNDNVGRNKHTKEFKMTSRVQSVKEFENKEKLTNRNRVYGTLQKQMASRAA